MDKRELLYDHYKETFEIIQNMIDKRNKYFVFCFIISFIQLILAFIPDTLYVVKNFIYNQYSIDIKNYFAVIQIFVWIIQDYTYLKYSQMCVEIERKYNYIHSLESRISNSIKAKFDRESKDYLNKYPFISKVTNFIYRYFSAVVLIIVSFVKIIQEILLTSTLFFKITDSFLFVLYLFILFSHLFFVVKNDK